MSFGKNVRQKEINGKTFQINLLRASDGISVAQKLSSVIATMFDGAGEDGDVSIDLSKIAKAISVDLSEKDMLEITGKLLKNIAVDGQEVNFDNYFAGNYGEFFKVMTFALQENFGNFFEDLATLE